MTKKKMTRREMLLLSGASGIGVALGATGFGSLNAIGKMLDNEDTSSSKDEIVPFYGKHQAGILTPAQNNLYIASFDLTTENRNDVKELLKTWTQAAEQLSKGMEVGNPSTNAYVPPADTGEAVGLSPSNLTITFGFGPTLFKKNGKDRYSIASKQPKVLKDLPPFSGDELKEEWNGGDLCIQICADDSQVAFHALRNLTRLASGKAVIKWVQSGFQRSHQADPKHATPRNLFGFKDGTVNPEKEDQNEIVWAQGNDGTAWMQNGSYMVVRRIRMLIEVWDRTHLAEQEATFGRDKPNGAPLGASKEFDKPDFDKKDANGKPVIPADSHMALARGNGKTQMLRRGYSYSSEMDLTRNQLDAGLIFISYQRDPEKQFIPVQQRLAKMDRLNEYIVHIGSAMFACPPGVKQGGYIGDTLF